MQIDNDIVYTYIHIYIYRCDTYDIIYMIYTCVYTHVRIYTHVYTYVHTYIHEMIKRDA